jgi:FkbM family methyltransferase
MATYYAQFQTDLEIKKYFPENYRGTCIEVGAGFGMHMSNTGYFEEIGWKCLCIEPIPEHFSNLRMYRRLCLNVACGKEDLEKAPFTVYRLKDGNQEAISSLKSDPRLVESHQELIENIYQIDVPVKKLDSILKSTNINHIDFMSIDTEGNEIEVLEGFDLLAWKVKLLVIENNFSDPHIEEYLSNFGYVLRERHGVNDFFEFIGIPNQEKEINQETLSIEEILKI